MKLGLLVQTEEGLDWAGWRRVYTNAERLGFHSVWISDHFQSPYAAERHGLDAWVALAVAAAETRRVVFGPLVSPITFRVPAIVARMAESLYDLSQGRFVLGLGLGWNAAEHAANRIIFPPAMERRRQLEEGIRQIRRDLDDRRVPLIIGGGGPRSLEARRRNRGERCAGNAPGTATVRGRRRSSTGFSEVNRPTDRASSPAVGTRATGIQRGRH